VTFLGWLVLGLATAFVFVGGIVVGRRWIEAGPAPLADAVAASPGRSRAGEPLRERRDARTPGESAKPGGERLELPFPAAPAPGRPAYLALVIDDLGRRLEDVDELEALGVELSYSVLPFEARTAEVVARLRRGGEEILLHLPMEPDGEADPGPGALRREMSERELARHTRAALEAVPGAVGVNNHMGSALSADERAMSAILSQIGGRGLFYLDSRTSAESVGFDLARRSGIAAARRDVFLDGVLESAAIRGQFRRLLEVARAEGAAVAIGHPHPETLAVLRDEVPKARALGYRFVPMSYLVERTGGE
jgi:polysaccharide deacetylase 2 family uncharacterized protein YibQ